MPLTPLKIFCTVTGILGRLARLSLNNLGGRGYMTRLDRLKRRAKVWDKVVNVALGFGVILIMLGTGWWIIEKTLPAMGVQ